VSVLRLGWPKTRVPICACAGSSGSITAPARSFAPGASSSN
jgi:hypothetical protein